MSGHLPGPGCCSRSCRRWRRRRSRHTAAGRSPFRIAAWSVPPWIPRSRWPASDLDDLDPGIAVPGGASAQALVIGRHDVVVVAASGEAGGEVPGRHPAIGRMPLAVALADRPRAHALPQVRLDLDPADGRGDPHAVPLGDAEPPGIHRIDLDHVLPRLIAGVHRLELLVPGAVRAPPLAVQTRLVVDEEQRELPLVPPEGRRLVVWDERV